MYFGMPKGTSRGKATSNSEKIKSVALAVIELCLPEGIRQAGGRAGGWAGGRGRRVGRQAGSRKFYCINFLKYIL